MIQTKSLTKTIGDKEILRGVNLTIATGESIAILGPNGAGKSTILKIIGGLLKPSSGEITIDSKDLKENEIEIKNNIGYLGHNSFLYEHYTPLENLQYFGKLYGVSNLEEKAIQLIDKVGLKIFLHEPIRSFSRGMNQRLAIARAILHQPKILLLDEPYTGLDQQAVKILNRVIIDMQEQGVTILMVSHDFHHVVQTCNRAIIIKHGMICDDFDINRGNVMSLTERYSGLVS